MPNPAFMAKREQTHCIHGHEFTLRNTRIRANGTRQCRACAAAESRGRQAAARAAGIREPDNRPRLTAEQRRALARRAGLVMSGQKIAHCHYCDEPGLVRWFGPNVRFVGLEVDHVVPISRGGAHDVSNMVLACSLCNRSKGNGDEPAPHHRKREAS